MLVLGSIVSLGYIGWFMVAKCTKVERDRMLLALVLIFGAVVFFTLFEQAGSSLNLFADRNVQLTDRAASGTSPRHRPNRSTPGSS